jgi:3-oxoacyl-[acyl-carrier-protein] synthase-1
VTTNVIGVGAVTPVGFDARQSALGLRAMKLAPRQSTLTDRRGERFGTARAVGFADDLFGVARMIELGARALAEAARDAGIPASEPLRVFVAVAERARPLPDSETHALAATQFLPLLERASKQRIDGAGSEVLRLGHAGFAAALERAIAAMGSGPVAVGGIDTYHHPEVLAWLDKQYRVLSDGSHNGFVPSEGAAFIVITSKKDRPAIARVTRSIAGIDQVADGEPHIAAVMTELVRDASTAMHARPIPWIITDMNGERHRAKEWSFVTIRNNDVIVPGKTREQHMGQLAGDAGAATGAIAAAFATVGFRTGFAPEPEVLLTLQSDGDERGIAILEAAT